MPKITVHGGPSNRSAVPPDGPDEHTLPDVPEDTSEADDGQADGHDDTEEEPSPGNSSSPSLPRTTKHGDGSKREHRRPVRTTASHSVKDQTESSSASPTAGSTPETTSDLPDQESDDN